MNIFSITQSDFNSKNYILLLNNGQYLKDKSSIQYIVQKKLLHIQLVKLVKTHFLTLIFLKQKLIFLTYFDDFIMFNNDFMYLDLISNDLGFSIYVFYL